MPKLGQAGELVMFWRAGCPYCAAWERDIGPIYPKTDDAKRLPLRRVDVATSRPDDLRQIADVRFTPTFVAIEDGREVGRIVGYGGDEQFWMQLAQIIASLPPAPAR